MTWKDEIRKDNVFRRNLGEAIDRRERSMTDKEKLERGLIRTTSQLAEMHEENPSVNTRDYYMELFEKIRDYNRDNRDYDEDKIIEFYDNLARLEFEARDVAKELERVAEYIREYAPEGE